MKRCLPLAVLMITICLICTVPKANADEYKSIEDASPQEIVDGMSNKLARGLANLTTGWLEIPKQIYLTSKEGGLAKGMTIGSFKGIAFTVGRTVSGALETATLVMASPGFYDPYFDPAYPWQELK